MTRLWLWLRNPVVGHYGCPRCLEHDVVRYRDIEAAERWLDEHAGRYGHIGAWWRIEDRYAPVRHG